MEEARALFDTANPHGTFFEDAARDATQNITSCTIQKEILPQAESGNSQHQ